MNTKPVDWIGESHEGYMVNTIFSEENVSRLGKLAEVFKNNFPDEIYLTPPASLHITLLDWIAPLVEYDGRDKAKLYAQVKDTYHHAMQAALLGIGAIKVHFMELCVSPSTIYVRGYDDGQFQAIRDAFLDRVELLPGTKLPPTIIHSSLGRFTREMPIRKIEKITETLDVDFMQTVESFRLVHSWREPLLEFEELRVYPLVDNR